MTDLGHTALLRLANTDSSPVDENGQIRDTGKKYQEGEIPFGHMVTEDQPWVFTLSLSELMGQPSQLPATYTLHLLRGVKVVNSGVWTPVSTVDPSDKPQTGHFTIETSVSAEETNSLKLGLSVAAEVSAKPLGVGVSATVGFSVDWTQSQTHGESNSTSTTLNYDLRAGEGGQGWALTGLVTASIPFSALLLPDLSDWNRQVIDVGPEGSPVDLTKALQWASDARYANPPEALVAAEKNLALGAMIYRGMLLEQHKDSTFSVTAKVLTETVAQTSFMRGQ